MELTLHNTKPATYREILAEAIEQTDDPERDAKALLTALISMRPALRGLGLLVPSVPPPPGPWRPRLAG